jgi:Rod binding domain-containing protein
LSGLPTSPILPAEGVAHATSGVGLEVYAHARRGVGEAEQAARDFESVLLHRLLEEMRRTIPESGLLETAISDQVQGLFWFYLAQEIARQGGLGLWKDLAQQLAPAGQGPSAAPHLELKA